MNTSERNWFSIFLTIFCQNIFKWAEILKNIEIKSLFLFETYFHVLTTYFSKMSCSKKLEKTSTGLR